MIQNQNHKWHLSEGCPNNTSSAPSSWQPWCKRQKHRSGKGVVDEYSAGWGMWKVLMQVSWLLLQLPVCLGHTLSFHTCMEQASCLTRTVETKLLKTDIIRQYLSPRRGFMESTQTMRLVRLPRNLCRASTICCWFVETSSWLLPNTRFTRPSSFLESDMQLYPTACTKWLINNHNPKE